MDKSKKIRISGTGCALVDYLYSPVDFNDRVFKRYISKSPGDGGLSPGKLVFTEELEKYAGEKYMKIRDSITGGMKPVAVNVGGPSIVSLIHVSQMLEGTNAKVVFYGCRGDDEAGRFIEGKLEQTPVETGGYKIGEMFTPFTDVFSDPCYDEGHGERAFVNNIGAAAEISSSDIDSSFYQSDVVVFGGTALVPGIHHSITGMLKKAREAGAITVVNTVYDFINEKKGPGERWVFGEGDESYGYTDLFIADFEEALRYSGTASADEAARFFTEQGAGAVVITHGPNPVSYMSDSRLFGRTPLSRLPVSEYVRSALLSDVPPSGDTTGCGDNFAGGVISSIGRQIISGRRELINLDEAVCFGIASGGFACFYLGGTWFEKYRGEKQLHVDNIYKKYLEQIKSG